MSVGSIILVEGDPDVRRSIERDLRTEGYDVSTAANKDEAICAIRERKPDLLMLNASNAGLPINQACRTVRCFSSVPILLMSKEAAEEDVVSALDAGADDYICEPCSRRELIARIRAILRRTGMGTTNEECNRWANAGIALDSFRRVAWIGERVISLTPREFDLIHHLTVNANRVLEREVLFESVWRDSDKSGLRTLDVHICWLRKKFEVDPAKPKMIVTIRGVGYKFVPQVAAMSVEEATAETS